MKKVYVSDGQRLPIKAWLDNMDDNALEQAYNLANLPFAFKHIALMPDCHMGYGMPIGGVLSTKDVIIPNAVGVDIGCGMCAVKTNLTEIDTDTLKKIMSEIRQVIPVGFNKHKEKQSGVFLPNALLPAKEFQSMIKVWTPEKEMTIEENLPICFQEYDNALLSIGTLGGGNHFIEIQKDTKGHIWIMLHSGSRNLGFKVAKHYNDLAIELNKKWFSSVPIKQELAFLPINSEEGQAYIREMTYCVEFALANRELMMTRIMEVVSRETGSSFATWDDSINIAHNYAALENHFGENVMVHRKGATLARKNTIGIIPGSQGTKSYIVKGKGNPDSFMSCSHGAGRTMGRKQAQRELDLESQVKELEDQGIIHSIRGVKDLDEAPGAYKQIEEVMQNQSDLVEVLVELTPLGCIKG